MRLIRTLANEVVTLGSPITLNLPRNYAYRRLALRLAGSITIASGSSSGTPYLVGAAKLLEKITIRREGRDQVIDLSGENLSLLNRILFATTPANTNIANGDAQANTLVNTTLILPFENIGGVKPFDTLLGSQGLSSLDLLITPASAASAIVDGGDRTTTVGTTAFTLNVMSVEETEVNGFAFGDIRMSSVQNINFSGASSAFQIKPLPVGNMYKGFLLVLRETSTGGRLTSSRLTNVRLKSGQEVFVDCNAYTLQSYMKLDGSIETLPTGCYYLDLMPDGRLNSALDVTAASGRQSLEFELELSAPSGTGSIEVIGLEYMPPVVVSK